MKEHNSVIQELFKIKAVLLGTITYIDSKKRLNYLKEIEDIIDRINAEYDSRYKSI